MSDPRPSEPDPRGAPPAVGWARRRAIASSWASSLAVHLLVLAALAYAVERPIFRDSFQSLIASVDTAEPLEALGVSPQATAEDPLATVELAGEPTLLSTGALLAEAAPRESAAPLELGAVGLESLGESPLLQTIGQIDKDVLAGRTGAHREALLATRGGSPETEAAVASGLAWLAAHQRPDGSWSFDHRGGACQGRCGNPGDLATAPMGATGLALLAFLGAGNTHASGPYQKQVTAGVRFLIANMRSGSLMDGGTMYSHGIATIALCEDLAMTQDRELIAPAQAAIDWIVAAQDPSGGGWRYRPRMPGDTSVTGWQLMALKSGHLGYLRIPPASVTGCQHFLDTVAEDEGAAYGYTHPGNGAGTTAVGLLCRMYLGWERDRPALRRGVEQLATLGPSASNMYYNYYATQVLHHFDEPELWRVWNEKMRGHLLASQSDSGHEAGSFYFGDGHDVSSGGRLYLTAMSVMTLEVYYRYQPLYQKAVVQDDFALELGDPIEETPSAETTGRGKARRP